MSINKKKKVVMTIANSPFTPYFYFFAKKVAEENLIDLLFVFIHYEEPTIIKEVDKLGIPSKWFYFDFRKGKKLQYLKLSYKFYKLFQSFKPDVVHTNLFDDSLPALLAAKWAGVKKRIITKQDTGYHYLYAPKGVRYDRINNCNATILIPPSQESFDFILQHEGGDPSKMKIIHHGVDIDEFTRADSDELNWIKEKFNPNGQIMIGTVARHVESKGYKYIIAAMEKIMTVRKDIIFVGAGSGPLLEEMNQLIQKKGLSENIILAGFIEKKYIPAFYQSLDIYIHASVYEPFGFVIPEAIFNRVPLITTSTGASRDALKHMESAYFIEVKSAEDIFSGIEFYLKNDAKFIIERAYYKASQMYTLENMWEGYRKLYLND